MNCSARLLLLILTVSVSYGDVLAQLTGVPVSLTAKELPELNTIVFQGDLGLPNDRAGEFTSIAGRLVWRPSRFSVLLGLGALLAERDGVDNGVTFGTSVGYEVMPGSSKNIRKPAIHVNAGLGYAKIGDPKQWNIPVALGAAWFLPHPKFNVKPWISARPHFRVSDIANDGTLRDFGFGVSTGIAISKLSGPGVQLGLELLRIAGRTEFTFAVGLHWDYALPLSE